MLTPNELAEPRADVFRPRLRDVSPYWVGFIDAPFAGLRVPLSMDTVAVLRRHFKTATVGFGLQNADRLRRGRLSPGRSAQARIRETVVAVAGGKREIALNGLTPRYAGGMRGRWNQIGIGSCVALCMVTGLNDRHPAYAYTRNPEPVPRLVRA